ncbi:MAG: hypothetical protein NTV70_11505 [Acidobacteria bacterium]|nr:hypothetical protein [Acidobacteriota bacterium]
MPATAPEVSRRHWLAACALLLPASARAASPRELLADLVRTLSNDDAAGFLRLCDKSLADQLRADIEGLCARYDITSSIEVLAEEELKIEADWYLELKQRDGTLGLRRRRERVTLEFTLVSKKLRLKSVTPRELLAPEPLQR